MSEDATRRTRLANERTFLAWWRTALGVYGVAVAIGQVLPEVVDDATWPYEAFGTALALLGAGVAGAGWWRHTTVDAVLSGGEEARAPGGLVAAMGAALVLVGAGIAALIVLA